MLPPPPRSTLFPYTTLFRSNLHFNYNRSHTQLSNLYQNNLNVAGQAGITGTAQDPFDYGVPVLSFTNFQSARDRKSTRLNSSHVSISYAVFCLKKKKKKII